jgi:Restriction endonuclease
MPNAMTIRILEKDNNRRGDLFGRLMNDLFLSLGYDDVRLNIARSGREIDIEAEHRMERRLALAECKALTAKAGGKEINAFAGKLRPEQRKHPGVPITPYFISLSGFTETSVDQEAESGDDAVILVDAHGSSPSLSKAVFLSRLSKPPRKPANALQACMDWYWMRAPNS